MDISIYKIKRYVRRSEDCLIYLFDFIDSTNTEAKRGGYPPNSVLIAKEQGGGRGRLGKSFFSPAGSGLYMSIVIKPWYTDIEKITARAGFLVIDAIREATGIHCEKRRINDIYLGGKKICGILTEGIINPKTQTIEKVVVGIGLNIFEPENGFPAELAEIAGALYKKNEKHIDINLIAARIIDNIFSI